MIIHEKFHGSLEFVMAVVRSGWENGCRLHEYKDSFIDHQILISSRDLPDSTPHFVGLLVCWFISPSHYLGDFAFFGLTAPAQMIKWPKKRPLPTSMQLG